jgi:superfamily II DNA/RNA helicase
MIYGKHNLHKAIYMGFSKFKLKEEIIKAVEAAGYSEPTKIQEESIPKILEKLDIRASAQTGTGKTAAFLLPALDLIARSESRGGKGPKVLILTPTRELAQQITVQAEKYSKFLNNVRCVCVVGGIPYHKQQAKLSRPYDILVATPGRLLDYMDRGKVKFENVEMVVLDEADRMLDMGFQEPVEEIISQTPQSRQTLLYSATLKGDVLKLSQRFMKSPVEINIHSNTEKHANIVQKLHYVDNLGHKNELLDHILNAEDLDSAIIFTATKRHCDELVEELEEKGFDAGAIHGDMNQRQRSRTIEMLKQRKINILVATDVAARGIDVPSISHVINFDLPRDTEDYVHRIGRTGRANAKGIAISFAGSKDIHMVPRIEKYTGQTISVVEIKGLEPKSKPQSSEKEKGRSRGGRGERRSSGGGRGFEGKRESRGSEGRRDFKDFREKRESRGSDDRKDFRKSDDRRESRGSDDRRESRGPVERRESRGPVERREFKKSDDRKDFRRSDDRRESRGSEDRRDFKRLDDKRGSKGSDDRGGRRDFGDRPSRNDGPFGAGRKTTKSKGEGFRSEGRSERSKPAFREDSRSSKKTGRSDFSEGRSFKDRKGASSEKRSFGKERGSSRPPAKRG